MARAPDQHILSYAQRHQRVCVTLDADFHALLALSNANAPSVIRIRQECLSGAKLANLLKVIWPYIGSAGRYGQRHSPYNSGTATAHHRHVAAGPLAPPLALLNFRVQTPPAGP